MILKELLRCVLLLQAAIISVKGCYDVLLQKDRECSDSNYQPRFPALSCYKYTASGRNIDSNTFLSSATIATGCAICKKTIRKTNFNGMFSGSHEWQCDGNFSATSAIGECKESVHVEYFPDGTFDTRICTCCTDKCNDENFCNDSNPLALKMQKAIEGQKDGPATFSCYEGSVSSGPRPVTSSETSTKVKGGCTECRKSATLQVVPGLGGLQMEAWNCNTDQALSACKPYIEATIFQDGSWMSSDCRCCNDRCNQADFCNLQQKNSSSIKTSSSDRVLRRNSPFVLLLTAGLVSAVLLQ